MGAIGGLVTGALGAISGSQQDKSTTTSTNTVNAGSANGQEQHGLSVYEGNLSNLQGMADAGPGQADVAAGTGASRDLASMLQQYSQTGGLPTAADISSANGIASNLFAPQQTALNQSFVQQGTDAARQAAIQGRAVSDPILQAKMRIAQTQQQSMLSANQGSFAQQFALQQPQQRLGFAQQRAGILGGLATQAMNNRQQLAAMGEGLMNNERNFRLATASRTGTQETLSGGGLKGAINGGLAGFGAGMNMFSGGNIPNPFGGGSSSSGGSQGGSGMNYGQGSASSGSSFFGLGKLAGI